MLGGVDSVHIGEYHQACLSENRQASSFKARAADMARGYPLRAFFVSVAR